MIRPTIVIKVKQYNQQVLDEVLAGIEEEGVLCEVIHTEIHHSPQILAKAAAEMSQLEVGIGIVDQEVYLTIHKLDGAPLLTTQVSYREIGHNAARYVKGNSFTQMIGGEL